MCACMYVFMQLSVSVSLVLITAMSMHCALTKMEALTVSALLVTLAMEHTVVVRCNLHVYHVWITYPDLLRGYIAVLILTLMIVIKVVQYVCTCIYTLQMSMNVLLELTLATRTPHAITLMEVMIVTVCMALLGMALVVQVSICLVFI